MRRRIKKMVFSIARHTGSGLSHMLEKAVSGVGAILVMHRVVARKTDSAAVNLTITTAFLDQALTFLGEAGVEFVSLHELRRRLNSGGPFTRPLVALTFDDGYRDNFNLALPILQRHHAPATIFVPSGSPSRTMDVWFLRLEKAVMSRNQLALDLPGFPSMLPMRSAAEKVIAYRQLANFIHRDMARNKLQAAQWLPCWRVSDEALAAEHFMSESELRQLATDPLISMGGHTINHPVLRNLTEADAFIEISEGCSRLASILERPVDLFAYPYGGPVEAGPREYRLVRKAGLSLAVTTRYDNLHAGDLARIHSLPRITLGGLRETIDELAFDVFGSHALSAQDWVGARPGVA